MSVFPRMTYYSRLLDNNTGEQLLGFTSTANNRHWYYGKVNGLYGGESSYLIEFDIWNNEPGWDGGTPQTIAQNAVNCRLSIDIPSQCRQLGKFLYARCITQDVNSEFEALSMSNKVFSNIQGNASDIPGTILGVSDHATIQTKIKLPAHTKITTDNYSFTLNFSYNFE